MLGDNESKTSSDAHAAASPAPVSREHEVWSGATAQAEKPQFVDDAPGDGCGMLESIPGFASFDLIGAGDIAGPVDGPVLDAAPWSWVRRLLVTYEDGSKAFYTGWLAAPRLVVTSGRCLYDHSRGAAREVAVEVAPAGNAAGRSWVKSSDFVTVTGWRENANPECDYGAITLAAPGLAGLGNFGLAWLPGGRPVGEWLNLSGYPVERSDEMQWFEGVRIIDASERFLFRTGGFHTAGAGSPLWLYLFRNGQRAQRYVCGMVGSNADQGNALRLHRDIYDNLLDWTKKASSAPQPASSPAAPPSVSTPPFAQQPAAPQPAPPPVVPPAPPPPAGDHVPTGAG
ncbi:trypsin-like serine peptidase [Methylocystis parvus]|uniref:Serine protease n=1 Tax=Methylocystis parvus TaxID=134 RepID=A0A6B8M5U1_9HYPH|nr:hypothetical protein [Methylocystis parvus]QGM97492.1 hypothetical protein F7D14_08460 [Methylocystis parvus]WBJ98588.1 hypothetical protein MMG94_11140 [Methylocystis parvus OBBP]